MKMPDLIEEIRRIGGELSVQGDRLHYRLPADAAPGYIEELRSHKGAILAELRQWVCDCPLMPGGEPVHRASCPAMTGLRERQAAVWFQHAEPDPAGDAVKGLLTRGEYVDEQGVIRKVQ